MKVNSIQNSALSLYKTKQNSSKVSFGSVSIKTKNEEERNSKIADLIDATLEKAKKIQNANASLLERIEQTNRELDDKMAVRHWGNPVYYANVRNSDIKDKKAQTNEYKQNISTMSILTMELGELYNELLSEIIRTDYDENLTRRRRFNTVNDVRGELANIQGYSSIAGYEQEKQILDKFFIEEIEKELAGQKDVDIPGSVLFFGPKGNGKTTFAKAFAAESGCIYTPVRAFAKNPVEMSYKFLDRLYSLADKAEEKYQQTGVRSILFADEFTRVADENSPILEELHEFLKDNGKKYHSILFATTNFPERVKIPLDADTIFPIVVSVDPPNLNNKIKILKHYLAPILTQANPDYEKLARAMEEQEQKYEGKYSINIIKDGICALNDADISTYTEQEIIDRINSTKPNITKEDMKTFKQNVDRLMKYKIG